MWSRFGSMTIRKKLFSWAVLLLLAGLASAFAAEPTPAAGEPAQLAEKHPLQRIVLVESAEAAKEPVPADDNFIILTGGLKAINREELSSRLIMGKGRGIDQLFLRDIVQVVAIYIRQSDFPLVDIAIPEQNIRDGTLRLVVTLGKLRAFKATGNYWFSESMLQTRLGIIKGDIIRLSELERSIAWANNTNPFRQVKVHLDPVPNTGEFDVILGVEEQLPLRFVAGYDNTGNEILGIDRYSAALTYGNLFGRDQQLTYQFITTREPKVFKAHSVVYQAPLSWRHIVQASASVVNVATTFLDGFFTQKGKSVSADFKYIIPFKLTRWQGELSANAGFRETDNNLEFSGTPVIGAVTDSFIATLSAAGIRDDSRGKWIINASVTGSPGKLNSRSGTRIYQENRLGSNPVFAHGNLLLQRSTLLANNLVSNLRFVGQLASGNLLSSEQFSVGGASTVRGYKERILSGDHGYMASHELQRRIGGLSMGKRLPKLEAAGALFWDYGRTIYKVPLGGQLKSAYLSSCGVGLRVGMGNRLSASVDVAQQLERVEIAGESHHRVHVKGTLSF